MAETDDWKETLIRPLAALSGAVGTLVAMLGLDPIIQAIVATSGTWFSLAAVFGGTIAPNVPAIPDGVGTQLLVAAAIAYGLIKLGKLSDAFSKRL